MRRRRAIWAMAILGAGVAGFLLVKLIGPPYPDLSEKNIARMRVGMSLKEVEAIIGAPPGNYDGREVLYFFFTMPTPYPPFSSPKEWTSHEGCLILLFDNSGQILKMDLHEVFPPTPLLERLKEI